MVRRPSESTPVWFVITPIRILPSVGVFKDVKVVSRQNVNPCLNLPVTVNKPARCRIDSL